MSVDTLQAEQIPWTIPELEFTSAREIVLEELCAIVLASLPRSDQRTRGLDYVRGLLETRGRKSIRNIAGRLGGPATEQRLHHFICDSTWDWRPVRRALAAYVTRAAPPAAWVARPMVIPKAGRNSVGVDRRFFATLGQVSNAQEACGVWAAWDDRSMPVNWRLHLSRGWLDDPRQRRRAAIPDSVVAESLGGCAAQAYLGMMHDWDLPVRPVVLDGRGTDPIATSRRFAAARVPVLIKINGDHPLRVDPAAMPGWTTEVPAARIPAAVRNAGCTVFWRDHPEAETAAPVAVSKVPVRAASRTAGAGSPASDRLLLVGIRENGERRFSEFWLTTMVEAAAPELLRLARLTRRVDHDFDEISDPLGIRDFTGRSFSGWHRHTTLASTAHAVAVLSR